MSYDDGGHMHLLFYLARIKKTKKQPTKLQGEKHCYTLDLH